MASRAALATRIEPTHAYACALDGLPTPVGLLQARELQSARKCECANTANLNAKHLDGMKEVPEASEASAGCGQGMCCDTRTALDLSNAAAPPADPTPACCS